MKRVLQPSKKDLRPITPRTSRAWVLLCSLTSHRESQSGSTKNPHEISSPFFGHSKPPVTSGGSIVGLRLLPSWNQPIIVPTICQSFYSSPFSRLKKQSIKRVSVAGCRQQITNLMPARHIITRDPHRLLYHAPRRTSLTIHIQEQQIPSTAPYHTNIPSLPIHLSCHCHTHTRQLQRQPK